MIIQSPNFVSICANLTQLSLKYDISVIANICINPPGLDMRDFPNRDMIESLIVVCQAED